MKSILIVISNSQDNAISSLQLANSIQKQGNKVSIYLLQDGVFCSLANENITKSVVEKAIASGVEFYVLCDDLTLRGFSEREIIPQVHVSSYSELIDLMLEKCDFTIGVL
ncbi:MAG: DsrH/TusB family sulfur relay protein [Euryarchaeota archaeon]|nr:DsrH/TusB family sulfur relay protein [Euryarchaeota archaeon]